MVGTGNRRAGDRRVGVLRRFARDRRGGFGMMLALAALPMTLAVGAGLDTAHVLAARSDLQNATDEAALSLAHQPYDASATGQTAADGFALQWVKVNFSRSDSTTPTATTMDTAAQVEVKSSAQVRTFFAGLLGISTVRINADSVVMHALTHVELSLVLDNTQSMNESDGSGSTKIATLKSASTTLIDLLSASASASGSGQSGVFRLAMAPFATYVNTRNVANPNNLNYASFSPPSWLTGTSRYSVDTNPATTLDVFSGVPTDRFNLFKLMKRDWGGCVESRPMPYDVNDATPSLLVPGTMFTPFFAPDEPDYYATANGGNVYFDNNYLDDGVTAPVATSSSTLADSHWFQRQANTLKYQPETGSAGPNKGCNPAYVQPLTENYASVKSAINALGPAGNTHIPFGLAWGWYLLSPNMPFSQAVAYGMPNLYKIVVLVTDGDNTYQTGFNNTNPVTYVASTGTTSRVQIAEKDGNRGGGTSPGDNSDYTGYGYVWQKRIAQDGSTNNDVGAGSTDSPQLAMNDRLKRLCRNMQAQGVILYTVPLRVTDANTKSLLQNCASPTNVGPPGTKYLDAQTGDQLKQAFANIAGQISALRIAR